MDFRCGYVAVVGRPNVGKSTLINKILGHKLNITSRKPQTTRHNLLGIKSGETSQAIYVDTPGMHSTQAKAINRLMNRNAESVIDDVDILVFVVDQDVWTDQDDRVLAKLKNAYAPIVLVINKVDKFQNKRELLPLIEMYQAKHNFAAIVPISATQGLAVDELEQLIDGMLPTNPPFYDEEQFTDKSERFLVAEIVREKAMRQTGKEVPYSVTVEIEQFKEEEKIIEIHALLLIERDSQKAILIGKGGEKLKQIGTDARKDMERLLNKKVLLKLWVRVKKGWSDDERALNSLGFSPD